MPTLGYVQRLYDFLRRHPTWVDGFWALVLLGFSSLWIVADELHAHSRVAAVPLALALSAVVALRRRMPEKMLLLAVLVGALQLLLDVQVNPGDFAMLVIIYTVAANGARWASRLALAGGLVASTISTLRWPNETEGQWADAVSAVFLAVPFLLAWVIGDSLRTRRAYYAELEERAARLQREREAQSKAAVAAERARIARELHDVVAHNVSVMVVQADGAAYVLDASPEQAKQALETISTTGRQALTEMRRLLGVLRAGDDGGGEYVPQPGVDQLTDLIEQVRGAGLPVAFEVEGSPGRSPAASSSPRTASCRRRSPTPASTAGPRRAPRSGSPSATATSASSSRTTAAAPSRSSTKAAARTARARASSACANASAWSAAPWTPGRAPAEASGSARCSW